MKRIVCMILALLMLLAIVPSLAEEASTEEKPFVLYVLYDDEENYLNKWLGYQDGEPFLFSGSYEDPYNLSTQPLEGIRIVNGIPFIIEGGYMRLPIVVGKGVFYLNLSGTLEDIENAFLIEERYYAEYVQKGSRYLWFAQEGFSDMGTINFGKATDISQWGDFFYGITSKNELNVGTPTPGKDIKAKKLDTLAKDTTVVDGETYLGWRTKNGIAYSVDLTQKPIAPKLPKGSEAVFYKGFIAIVGDEEVQIITPGEEPKVISVSEYNTLDKASVRLDTQLAE